MLTALVLGSIVASLAQATPNTCQPREQEPLLPIFHIIGNVTGGAGHLAIEDINDISAIVLFKGVYHVFHQCCQNHWDHMVTKDLIHWTRLPPPLVPVNDPTSVKLDAAGLKSHWYDAHGDWDGSLTILSAEDSPTGKEQAFIIEDIVEGPKPFGHNSTSTPREFVPRHLRTEALMQARARSGDPPTMALALAMDMTDPYLTNWKKDAANPIAFTGPGCSFPSEVWKNGDHWNFISYGTRYTTKDPSFHTWGAAPGPKFANYGENGGQWFSKIPNQMSGAAPPASSGNRIINEAGGNSYAFGTYDAATETWNDTKVNGVKVPSARTDDGPGANWGTGQFAGDRMFNIFWSDNMRTSGLSILREIHHDPRLIGLVSGGLVSNPPKELANLRNSSLAHEDALALVAGKYVSLTGTGGGAADSADVILSFAIAPGLAHTFGACVLSEQSVGGATPTEGVAVMATVGLPDAQGNRIADVSIGECSPPAPPPPPSSACTGPDCLTRLMNNTDLSGGDGPSSHHPPGTDPKVCQAICDNSTKCKAWTYVIRGSPPGSGDCCTKITIPCPNHKAVGMVSGVKTPTKVSACGQPGGGGRIPTTRAQVPVLKGEERFDMRILVDRSIIEAFLMGGRAVFTEKHAPPKGGAPPTFVSVVSSDLATTASASVWSMGCGWTEEPWCAKPPCAGM